MGAGPAASLKGRKKFCTFGGGGDLSILRLLHTFVAGQLQTKSLRIVGALCGVQSILQVSEHPSLPAPTCDLLELSLLTLPEWPFPGLLWPLITSLSPFLSPSNSPTFCPRQVYTKLKWCQQLLHPMTPGST